MPWRVCLQSYFCLENLGLQFLYDGNIGMFKHTVVAKSINVLNILIFVYGLAYLRKSKSTSNMNQLPMVLGWSSNQAAAAGALEFFGKPCLVLAA